MNIQETENEVQDRDMFEIEIKPLLQGIFF